jgi:hypothetical protein
MRKIFAASALLAVLALTGCAEVDSGTIKDKVRESGRTEMECKGTGTKKKCKWEVNPDKCTFQLDNGKDRGWLEVDCREYDFYNVGEHYPEDKQYPR